MKAAEDGNESIISQLLMEKVDSNAVNKKGRTAMSFAASPSHKGWPSKIGGLSLLLSIGADSSILDHEGFSAERRARKEQRWAAVNVFKQQRISYLRSSETCVAIRREDRMPAAHTSRSQRSFRKRCRPSKQLTSGCKRAPKRTTSRPPAKSSMRWR